jgi:peptide-methionine (R)-S-oxide reductase
MKEKIKLTEEEWKKKLTPEEYHILREKGTERPFSGKLLENKKKGKYVCAGCGNELFDSDDKFDSGTGWPSFTEPSEKDNVEEHDDLSYGMARTEVLCSKCGGHLGHVFDDGPKPTGKRYCMNSSSLKFQEKNR